MQPRQAMQRSAQLRDASDTWLIPQTLAFAKPTFKSVADLEPMAIGKDVMQGRRRPGTSSAAGNCVQGCISSQTLLHKVVLPSTGSPCYSKHREMNFLNEKEKLIMKKDRSVVKSWGIRSCRRGLWLQLGLAQRMGRRCCELPCWDESQD